MGFQPLGERILAKRKEEVIELSKAVAERGEIKKGDVIYIGQYAGSEIKLEDESYIVLDASEKSTDILGIHQCCGGSCNS